MYSCEKPFFGISNLFYITDVLDVIVWAEKWLDGSPDKLVHPSFYNKRPYNVA